MTDQKQSSGSAARWAAVLGFAAMAYVVLQAVFISAPAHNLLAQGDNDDIMRILSVRAWFGGQDWFDMTAYRVLAPEGVSLHWSRYVDLGIAAMIWPLTFFMSFEAAEAAALVWWPTLMLLGVMAMTAIVGRRVFGPWVAALALASLALWPILSHNYFEPTRMDHHNVQITLMTLVVLTLLAPRPRVWLGAVAGMAAALSLAVGLENLLPIALAGVILCLRVVLDPQREGGALLGFSATLGAGSVLAFVGQTARANWFAAQCDQLSLPFLAVALSAVFVSTVLVFGARRLPHRGMRLGLLALATAVSLAALAPLLVPCLAGPYAHLPIGVQTLIFEGIREALPLTYFLQNAPGIVYTTVLPLAAALLVAALVLGHRLRHGTAQSGETRAVTVLLAFAALGLIGAVFQIRMILMGAAAVPLLTGYAIFALVQIRAANPGSAPASLATIATVAATLFAPILYPTLVQLGGSISPAAATTARVQGDLRTCRLPEHLAPVADMAPGIVLAPSGVSTSLLLLSDHTVLSAPYHRSADAIANGNLPFNKDEAFLRATLARTGADYVLLCRFMPHDPTGIAMTLIDGAQAEGLTPIALPDGSPLMLFAVTP